MRRLTRACRPPGEGRPGGLPGRLRRPPGAISSPPSSTSAPARPHLEGRRLRGARDRRRSSRRRSLRSQHRSRSCAAPMQLGARSRGMSPSSGCLGVGRRTSPPATRCCDVGRRSLPPTAPGCGWVDRRVTSPTTSPHSSQTDAWVTVDADGSVLRDRPTAGITRSGRGRQCRQPRLPSRSIRRPLPVELATSQMCPPGSRKLAVRIPQGLSIGPLSSSTPHSSQSLARRVDVLDAQRELEAGAGGRCCDRRGCDQVGASLARNRLTSVSPNRNTAESASS